ncbi:DAK2 domain-containing protein [Amycolatopsis aidingensis]|uniref:DAK2 domain-containing protein n=1 Tax=Amycolatopsis aidingensis TaxID=2842453 RepID=UPI001C0C1A93|nr:DAK2 domain-containing protein [Amycolatopsis aidingensis]
MRALDAAAVTAWAAACVRSLEALRADIDGINVYPVADSDTGSNLLHTLTGARDALAAHGEPAGAGEALAVLARGAVRAARGNSGVIVSQVLRGLAESAAGRTELDGQALAAALLAADRTATEAVAHPVAGTMLTVLHTAVAPLGADRHRSAAEVACAVATAAAEALDETPHQLPALATAGVVDAGGRGLVAVLDALVTVVTGTQVDAPRRLGAAVARQPAPPTVSAWEVMYLLDEAEPARLPELRTALSELGDSVTVAGDGSGSHAVHVHCADIGAAIEAGLAVGRPHQIRVEPLLTAPQEAEAPPPARSVLPVVHGTGLAELVTGEGQPVLRVPEGSVPTVAELLGSITGTGAAHVTVLPADAGLTAAVDKIAGHPMLDGLEVVVVPCGSPVQVLAALAVHDPARRTNDDVVAMAEAAAATRRGELLVAREEAITWVGRAHAGDLVGLVDGEVVLIEPEPDGPRILAAALTVLERMLAAGGELVTVLTGAGAPDGIGDTLADRLRAERPEVELSCYPGGQESAVLLIGVE